MNPFEANRPEAGQQRVQQWFNSVYREKGIGYLRPPSAYPIFLQLLDAQPGRRLLDIACGPGHLLRAARERSLEAVGVDLSDVAVEMAPVVAPGAAAFVANAERLPFPDQTFDYVTCLGSLERFLDRDGALREMGRVARPSARFCLMVRNARTFTWRVLTQWLGRVNHQGHQDADTLEGWTRLLEQNGFTIEHIHPDQWYWQKWRNRFSGRPSHPEPVAKGILPLRLANEFIFVCSAVSRESRSGSRNSGLI